MTDIEDAKAELMRAGCLEATDPDAIVALAIATFGLATPGTLDILTA